MAEESARYRKLYPRAWKSFRGLSLEEKAIAVYILTGDQTNRIGLFDFSIGKAIEELETLPQTFHKGFSNVIRTLDWEYDNVNRVLYISTWWKWNPPENPNVLKGNLKDLLEVANSPLIAKFTSNTKHLEHSPNLLETFIQTFAERYPKPSSNQEQEQEQEKDIVGKAAHVSLSPVALAEVWNQHAPACLPRVRFPISGKRQKKFRSALNGQGENYWVDLFQDIDRSEFYTGRDGKWTGMDFDWAVLNHEKLRQKLDRPMAKEADHPRATCLPEDPPGILVFNPDCPVCHGDPFKTMGKCKCATQASNQDQRKTEHGTTSQTAEAST